MIPRGSNIPNYTHTRDEGQLSEKSDQTTATTSRGASFCEELTGAWAPSSSLKADKAEVEAKACLAGAKAAAEATREARTINFILNTNFWVQMCFEDGSLENRRQREDGMYLLLQENFAFVVFVHVSSAHPADRCPSRL